MPNIRSILKSGHSEPIIRVNKQVTWVTDYQRLRRLRALEPALFAAYILLLTILLHWGLTMILNFVFNVVFSYFLLAVVIVVYTIYRFTTGNEEYWSKRNVRYIQNCYLTGYLTGNQSETISEIYRKFTGEKYGGLFFLNKPVLIILDPELIDSILVKNFPYFQNREVPEMTHDPLAANLFSLRGQKWRDQRYKLLTTFTADKLETLYGQISSSAINMMEKLEEVPVEGNEAEVKSVVFEYALNIISSCAFGVQFTSFRFKTFMTMVKKVFTNSPLQILRFATIVFFPKLAEFINLRLFPREICDYFMNLTKLNLKFRKDNKVQRDDYFQQLVTLHEQAEPMRTSGTFMIKLDGSTDDAVISQMQYTEENTSMFTEDTVCANSFSFLVSAKAVSGTISHILLELSRHPDTQERLYQEVTSALSRHGSCSYQALQEMTFLDQVIQEVQRMYPFFPTLMRECTKPFKVPGSELTVEPGVLVLIPVAALHRDPHHYSDPDLFLPGRFEGNNYMPSSTYLPYGNGPRICIAMRFAVLQMKTCVARIVSRYSVKLSNKTKVPSRFASGSFMKNEMWLMFEKRDLDKEEVNMSEYVLS